MRLDVRTDPVNARYYQVIDKDSGQVIPDVVAVDDEDQWYEVYKKDDKGHVIEDEDGRPIVLIKRARIQLRHM